MNGPDQLAMLFGERILKRMGNRMKRLIILFSGVWLMMGTTAHAADITWGTATGYSSASDVSTVGTLIEAINACGSEYLTSPLINGVQFVGNTGLMSGDANTTFFFGDTGDTEYNHLLNALDYASSQFSVGNGQLEVGKEYLIQLWYLDERSSSAGDRSMAFGDGNGNASPWVDDGYVIGTFIANNGSQTITVQGYNNSDSSGATSHVTAYQIRDLSSPVPTLSTVAGDTVAGAFTVSVGFSEEVTGLTAGDFEVVNGSASSVSGSGASWSVDITPSANGDVTVTLPADCVVDATDGHGNVAANTVLTTYVAPGSEQPVPTLSTATNRVSAAFTVQVDFNEVVTGLQASDFEVSGGTASSLSGSGASYSLVVSPDFGGDVTVGLPRNSVTDTDGDGLMNVASDELVVAYYVTVTVNSPEELLPYLEQDNVTATLSPGTYTITATDVSSTFGTPRFEFWGSNSTYDFTGVTLNFAADIYTSDLSMNHIQIFGNDNVLKNLTMVDLCDVDGALSLDGGVNLIMDGRSNRVEGFHMTIKGSYPYGYGDCFGKGATWTIKHSKHSGFLIRGESNHAQNCTLIQRSYGHCMFMQAASNPTIEGCYIEGEVRSTDDMLAETSGPAYDIDFMTVWGFTLPAGYMKSLTEAGIRAYNAGNTYIDGVWYSRGTSNPTILDNTIVNARVGVTLTHATGSKYVSGCTAIGTERGYAIGSGIIENCKADVKHGPAFGVDYDSDSGVTADITIIPHEGDHYNGSRHVAYIFGSDHNLTFRGLEKMVDQDLEINVGGDLNIESSSNSVEDRGADSIIINNYSGYPLILDDASTDNSGYSCGTISDAGTGNRFTTTDWSVTSNITFYGDATQSSISYDAPAFLAIDQNTSGQFGEGSVTHTSYDAQPWWQVELENPCEISEIRVWGRTDTAQSRLSNYDVTVFNSEGQSVWTSYQSSYPNPMVSLNTGSVIGQVVRVQLRGSERLSLAEVEIFGAVVAGPGGLTADSSSGQIILDWAAVTDATGYTVKRATVSGGPYTSIGSTSDLSFTDSTALDGTFYYYVVTATIDGNETTPSDEVIAIIGSAPAKFVIGTDNITASGYQDPNIPPNTIDGDLGTRWSANGDGQWIRYDLGAEKNVHSLKIAWLNGASRVASFHIETSNDDTTWTALTETLQSSGTTDELEAVDVTTTLARYVRIVGYGNTANSWNSITEVEIWGTLPSPPSVPADLTPTSGDGQVALSWTVSDGATVHHLKRSTTNGSEYTIIASEAGGSHLDTNVVNGTTYFYVISAESPAGESADSAQVSTKPYAPISADELVTPTPNPSGSSMEFSVESVSGRIYQLQRKDTLAQEGWEDVGDPVVGSGDLIILEDPDTSLVPKGFYRLQIQP